MEEGIYVCLTCHFVQYLSYSQTRSSSDYRGLKKLIAAISENARRVQLEEGRRKRLDPDFSGEDIICISRPPSALSHNPSTFKRDSNLPQSRRGSCQLPPILVQDFLDLPDHAAGHGPLPTSWRSTTLRAHVPRPSSLRTLSTGNRMGPSGHERREYRLVQCWSIVRC